MELNKKYSLFPNNCLLSKNYKAIQFIFVYFQMERVIFRYDRKAESQVAEPE